MQVTEIIYGVLVLWLLTLSYFLYKIRNHYHNLIKRTKKRKIDEILDFLIEKDDFFAKEINQIKKTLEKIAYQQRFHYQKIGFLRFNPFERVGGEQSFIVALLDKEDNGLLLNFLYTREGIRVYAKRVNKGTNEEYELSAEEKEAIKKAK
jgi:hypothetical protein